MLWELGGKIADMFKEAKIDSENLNDLEEGILDVIKGDNIEIDSDDNNESINDSSYDCLQKKKKNVKSKFMSMIFNEFQIPLDSIKNNTNLLLGESEGELNNEQQKIIVEIKEDQQKIYELINNLLQLSKINENDKVYNMKTCYIDSIIDTSTRYFSPIAERKDISLSYAAKDDLPTVKGDQEKLAWVINNLISNALKFTNAGDNIVICAYEENAKIFVSVKDSGMGIPLKYINKIFDKFLKINFEDGTTQDIGLGLSIVKEIIEAHGGSIWCESELDAGSTFIFALPLVNESSKIMS